jgi:pimeloyl-ACP methyl ester carboxylesterase
MVAAHQGTAAVRGLLRPLLMISARRRHACGSFADPLRLPESAMSVFPRPHPLLRLVMAALALVAAASAHAAPERFRDLQIDVVGEGRPVMMIPGLNSGADTWTETCAALQADRVQCHIVQLPGFAGLAPIETDAFLPAMRERLLDYLRERRLERPVVMGHSLGGFLALQMAIAAPDTIERLIIVDSLPFMPAAINPQATPENSKAVAEQMRQSMLHGDRDSAQYRQMMSVFSRSPERVDTIVEWGRASDRAAGAQAMYELMTTDLREQLDAIKIPTLVLSSWAGYAHYGVTEEMSRGMVRNQFAKLQGVRIEMSRDGYHFLMWDDPLWLQAQVRGFIATAP